jgi:hypothetical protein
MIRRTVIWAAGGKQRSVHGAGADGEGRRPLVAYAEGHRVETVMVTTGPVDPHGDAPRREGEDG